MAALGALAQERHLERDLRWIVLAQPGALVRSIKQTPGTLNVQSQQFRYALIRACAANPKYFHAADGGGYRLPPMVLQTDGANPRWFSAYRP